MSAKTEGIIKHEEVCIPIYGSENCRRVIGHFLNERDP
jgi:hypothetical protein